MKEIIIRNIDTEHIRNEACDGDMVRMNVTICFKDTLKPEADSEAVLWYLFDSQYEKYLCSDRCDGIIVQILYYAMFLGYDVISSGYPMSQQLWYNLTKHVIPQLHVMGNRRYSSIELRLPLTEEKYGANGVATGISRGVDSFATYYEYKDYPIEAYRLTHLVFFNVGAFHGQGVKNRTTHERFEGQLKGTVEFCKKEGYPLLVVDSNLSTFLTENLGRISFHRTHTFRNLGTVLLFQKLFRLYYYAPAFNMNEFKPDVSQGSDNYERWLIRHLLTENTTFYISNENWRRIDKMKFLSDKEGCFDNLLVCWSEDKNCGECEKCLRTLIQLDALGGDVIDRFAGSFDLKKYYSEYRDKCFSDLDTLIKEDAHPEFLKEAFYEALKNRPELLENSSKINKLDKPHKIEVTSARAVIRESPTTESEILSRPEPGTVLSSSMRVEGWYRIECDDGRIGWIAPVAVKRYKSDIADNPEDEVSTQDKHE